MAKGRGRGRMFAVEGVIDKGEDLAASQHFFVFSRTLFCLSGLSSESFCGTTFFHRRRCKAIRVFVCLGYWPWENW